MESDPVARRGLRHLRAGVVGAAFSLLYNQFAWAYDRVSRTFFRGQWRHWQRQALRHLGGIPGRTVLELGFGTGDLQIDLARAGYQAVGIDLSAAMGQQARRKARRQGVRLRLARARSQALPFPSATFAAVISTFPSDYIADPRTVAEIARVLCPGGRLVVVPGAWLLPVDRANRLLDRVARLVYGTQTRDPAYLERALAAAFPEFAALLAAHGLSARVLPQRLPRSMVLVIRADKGV